MYKSRHKYDYDAFVKGNNSAAHILSMVDKGGALLEIGAGQGAITKLLINLAQCEVSTIEIDDNSIEKLKEFCNEVYKVDLNSDNWTKNFTKMFDTVVAADVLEHLYNPLEVLLSIKQLTKEDGHIIISLPHIGHNAIHACLLDGDFAYTETGLLDFTHIRFFAIRNIQNLFDNAGLHIVDVKFVIRDPKDTEFKDKWDRLSPKVKSALSSNKYGNVYQCVIKASLRKPVHEVKAINLYLVDEPRIGLARRLNRLTKKYLPKSINNWLRKFYIELMSR